MNLRISIETLTFLFQLNINMRLVLVFNVLDSLSTYLNYFAILTKKQILVKVL